MTDSEATGPSLWRGCVLPEWRDYNGHMTEHRYLQVFGESSDALYGDIGIDFTRAAEGAFYTLETHIRHLREARLGTALLSQTAILGYDEKRLHLRHRLLDGAGTLVATGEHLSVHVVHGRSCAAPQLVLDRIAARFAMYETIPVPEGTGSVLLRPLRVSRPSKPVA